MNEHEQAKALVRQLLVWVVLIPVCFIYYFSSGFGYGFKAYVYLAMLMMLPFTLIQRGKHD